ncbi:hypothetical protein BDFB_007354, partial [Asbolus verrucosus]
QSIAIIPTSSVPRGSNLGPLLFLSFINYIAFIIIGEKLLFVDDLKFFCSVTSSEDCQKLQSNINLIYNWCRTNHLYLNILECNVITFTKKKTFITCDCYIEQVILSRHCEVRDLGILFVVQFSFSSQINNTVNSALKTLDFIHKNCKDFHDEYCLNKLYYTIIRYKLEYCCLKWKFIYLYHKNLIESAQRHFLNMYLIKENPSYPPRSVSQQLLLKEFNVMELDTHRIIIYITFLYNLINNKIDC